MTGLHCVVLTGHVKEQKSSKELSIPYARTNSMVLGNLYDLNMFPKVHTET